MINEEWAFLTLDTCQQGKKKKGFCNVFHQSQERISFLGPDARGREKKEGKAKIPPVGRQRKQRTGGVSCKSGDDGLGLGGRKKEGEEELERCQLSFMASLRV